MSADQTKFAYQLILVTIAFLRPIDKREEKAHTYYFTGRAVSETVRGWLTGRN